ncbi:MAG: hypothetical protein N3H30_00345 [Candidatus Micrarchaeota archaeon]|nr:hypothetical protein [Candidatus Micrarchaeota archaeon]
MMQKSETVMQKQKARGASPFMKMLAAGTIMVAVACGGKQETPSAGKQAATPASEMVCRMPNKDDVVLKSIVKASEGQVCKEGAKTVSKPEKVCEGTACAEVHPAEKEASAKPEAKAEKQKDKKEKPQVFSIESINIPQIPKEPKTLEELKMKPEDRKRLKEDIAALEKELGIKK